MGTVICAVKIYYIVSSKFQQEVSIFLKSNIQLGFSAFNLEQYLLKNYPYLLVVETYKYLMMVNSY